ncbi:MAG: hypothetical protein RM338_14120 [Nostoc sp. DedQUE12a]|nr:hypothetical protein [Nostoc sp. DedQUE12a]
MLEKIAIAKIDTLMEKIGYLLNFPSRNGEAKQVLLHTTELRCVLPLNETRYIFNT